MSILTGWCAAEEEAGCMMLDNGSARAPRVDVGRVVSRLPMASGRWARTQVHPAIQGVSIPSTATTTLLYDKQRLE